MNAETEKISNDWMVQAEKLLEGHTEQLLELKQLWNTKKLKEAYLFMDEFVQKNDIKPSLEFQKLDESFYWLLR